MKWKWLKIAIASLFIAWGSMGIHSIKLFAASPTLVTYGTYFNQVVIYWDPADGTSNEILMMSNIYEKLVKYDNDGTVIPDLAERWEVSQDGLNWTFYLRRGVQFHLGGEMTAEDVKFSIDRTRNRGKGFSHIWASVQQIDVVDPYTVRFILKYPAPLDLLAASGYASYIISKAHTEAMGKQNGDDGHKWFNAGNANGTGPYTIATWKKKEAVLKKFPAYWKGWAEKSVDIAIIKSVTEASTRRQMLEAGQIDIASGLPNEMIRTLRKNPKIEVLSQPSIKNLIAHMNTENEYLKNPLVRQAVSYAFPYQSALQTVLGGFGTQLKGVVPPSILEHCDDLPQYHLNLDKAKALLQEAGYPNGGFKLVFTHSAGNEDQRKLGELFKAELVKLGIELQVLQMPWESQWNLAKSPDPKRRQAFYTLYWWGANNMLDNNYMQAVYKSEDTVNFNLSYHYDEALDKLIEEGSLQAGIDKKKSKELFCQAQTTVVDKALTLLIWNQDDVMIVQKSLNGFELNPAYTEVVFFHELSK